MKKKVLISGAITLSICLIMAILIIFLKNFDMIYLEAYINYGVSLEKPLSTDIIYRYSFGEGEDFYIFNYDSDKDIEKIIQKNGFKKITESNLEEITKILNIYHDDLCEKELSIFDKTTNISNLTKIGNYYLYPNDINMVDDNDYSIQIIFPKERKVYHFAINH